MNVPSVGELVTSEVQLDATGLVAIWRVWWMPSVARTTPLASLEAPLVFAR